VTRRIAMRIEYDGGGFLGYQRQKDPAIPTVQGLLEDICSEVLDEPVTVVCAGRTDAGVHATGQVVHVRTESARPLDTLVRALVRNAHGRIGVRHAWEAPPWFHARHSASRRTYQYHLLVAATPRPVVAQRAWHYSREIDFDLLQSEGAALLGRRDFRAFCSGGEDLKHYFRTIHRLEWRRLAPGAASPSYLVERLPLWHLEIEADAFLPRMVRMLVATLVDVAAGRRPPGTAARVLRGRDARQASAPAPPQGLCLVRVDYPPACRVPPPGAPQWGEPSARR